MSIRLVMIKEDGSKEEMTHNFDCGDAWHSRYNLRLVAEELIKRNNGYVGYEYNYYSI